MAGVEIVGLSGSLRKESLNTALLRAAAELAEAPVRLSVHGIAGIPLYDGDLEEADGLPESVRSLKETIASAEGLLIATPEYNNSLPGPLKNAIDWCSRPASDIGRVFGGKPVALCGATPGRLGTTLAQTAWLPVFRTLGLRYWPRQILVPGAHQSFSAEGGIQDEKLRERLRSFVAEFAAFCAAGVASEAS